MRFSRRSQIAGRCGGVRHDSKFDNGLTLHVDETRRGAHRVTEPKVRLGFDADDLVVLPRNG